jgi:protein-disulfide isomerase
VAEKPKRPERFDLKSAGGKSSRLIPIVGTAVVVLLLVGVVFWIVSHKKPVSGGDDAVRVTSSKLVTKPGTSDPKVVVSFYEDFLCPACGNFEQTFGQTVSNLIDIGAIAADYSTVAILDKPQNQNYSSRAGAASLCVADESKDKEAYRRFRSMLFSKGIQPDERATSFPDNAQLIEHARVAGVQGTVPDCVNSGKYLDKVKGAAKADNIKGTPTVKINGEEYQWSTPEALVAKIKGIVGDVPGIDTAAAAPAQS